MGTPPPAPLAGPQDRVTSPEANTTPRGCGGHTTKLVYAVVPQSSLPKETIQCGGALNRPTENKSTCLTNPVNLIFPHRWLVCILLKLTHKLQQLLLPHQVLH